jgi:hypothetical protein
MLSQFRELSFKRDQRVLSANKLNDYISIEGMS